MQDDTVYVDKTYQLIQMENIADTLQGDQNTLYV